MSRVQRLTAVLVLNLALVAGLVVVGIGAHSLSVLAEGGDYLLDAAGAGPGPAGDPALGPGSTRQGPGSDRNRRADQRRVAASA